MSIYGYLCCHDCRQKLWLGKAIFLGNSLSRFHIGNGAQNWQQEKLNQVLWKFISAHTSHCIDARLEHDMTEDMLEYSSLGGEADNDISFDEFLAKHDWSSDP